MKKRTPIILAFAVLVWIISLFAVNKLSNYFIDGRNNYEIPAGLEVARRSVVLPWLNFDGRNYLTIAYQGYKKTRDHNLRAFFPLYPFLINRISQLTGINVIYSGLYLSFLCALGSIYVLYRLVKEEYDEKIALKAILLLLIFPTSYYLLSYYTESLFLLLSLLVFWSLKKKRFSWATLFSILVSATRVVGVVVSLIVLFEAVRFFLKKKRFPYITFFSPFGLVGYSIYSYMTTKDPFIFLHSWLDWGKSFSLFGPLKSFFSGLYNILVGVKPSFDSPFVYPISTVEFMSLIFLIGILYWSYKKIKFTYWLYLLINSYVLLAGGILQSLPRYILVLFPIYIYLAKVLKGKRFVFYGTISFILLILLSALFLRNYWVA